jgi:hypothetical protein
VLTREELKMEIRKYKNISLKIIKDFQATGQKVPGYANKLVQEENAGMDGLKVEKSSNADNLDGESMFEEQSEIEEEIPEKVQAKLDKLDDLNSKLNIDLKDKNEKILELLSELEEIKIQVFARDKSIELQQRQIEELLEELRESKGLENDVKILVQKKMALQDENERLKDELNKNFMEGTDNQMESDELIMINNGLNDTIKQL